MFISIISAGFPAAAVTSKHCRILSSISYTNKPTTAPSLLGAAPEQPHSASLPPSRRQHNPTSKGQANLQKQICNCTVAASGQTSPSAAVIWQKRYSTAVPMTFVLRLSHISKVGQYFLEGKQRGLGLWPAYLFLLVALSSWTFFALLPEIN